MDGKVLDVVKDLKKSVFPDKCLTVDNVFFRLHYRFTVIVLFAFSILVSCKQYIGDPIECTASVQLREQVIDQYCWVSSTHTVPNACSRRVGSEVIYPCVDKHVAGEEVVTHQYYQWVCFVLFLQALAFYLPHYLWKSWEGGRLRALTCDVDGPLLSDEVKRQRIDAITVYFRVSLHHHRFYAVRYSICEVLNFCNVVGQMFLTDRFLGGAFLTYGTEVIDFTQRDQMNRTDPMVIVFPRVTKCTFYTFGVGGNPQNHDAICVLPINIINEKIYIFLWFWFIILAVSSSLALIYRILIVAVPHLRVQLLRFRAASVDSGVVERISAKISYGDWFILYLLCRNISSYVFRDVAEVVDRQLSGGEDFAEGRKLIERP